MLLVGVLLVGGLVVPALGGTVAYVRSGYSGDFWKLARDEKLYHVAANGRGWWVLSVSQFVGLLLLTSGLAGLTHLFSEAGEAILGFVAFGAYLLALMTWILGLTVQTATIPSAAKQQAATGEMPAWVHGSFDIGYLAEAVWVIGANLAYAVIGVAILGSGLLAAWAGWLALALAVMIPVSAIATKYWFPEMSLLVPFVTGIALVVQAL